MRPATKLHVQFQFNLRGMKKLFRRSFFLNERLSMVLGKASDSYHLCYTSGIPLHSRKVSFDFIIAECNEHLQVVVLFILELGNLPILHTKEVATVISSTSLMTSRDMNAATHMVTVTWFDAYGPPLKLLSSNPAFGNSTIKRMCVRFHTKLEPCPARKHKEIGRVESDNKTIRKVVKTLLSDELHFCQTFQLYGADFEILSSAKFFKNVIYGSKLVSSIEQAHGSTAVTAGLPKRPVLFDVLWFYLEQVFLSALHTLMRSRTVHTIPPHLLSATTPIYFYENQGTYGSWCKGYVAHYTEQVVSFYKNNLQRAHLHINNENIWLLPESSQLAELDKQELRMRFLQ